MLLGALAEKFFYCKCPFETTWWGCVYPSSNPQVWDNFKSTSERMGEDVNDSLKAAVDQTLRGLCHCVCEQDLCCHQDREECQQSQEWLEREDEVLESLCRERGREDVDG